MSVQIKAALIVAAAVVVAMAIYIYFSPYQTCRRVLEIKNDADTAALTCAHMTGGN